MYSKIKTVFIESCFVYALIAPILTLSAPDPHAKYIFMLQAIAVILLIRDDRDEKTDNLKRIDEFWEKVKSILP